METVFPFSASLARVVNGRARRAARAASILTWVLAALVARAVPVHAQEQILFPAVRDVRPVLLQKIRQELVRIDIALWLLTDREISAAVVSRHQAGVPVRVLGDRAAIFESDPITRREFEYLAGNGVPIRLRYNPRSFPEAMHWKCGIFVGQNTVEFGSANWTPFELKPSSATNFKDETAMFTDDPSLVFAFRTMFDRMWADTVQFLDWPAAYTRETGVAWGTPMSVSRARLEPDVATDLPDLVWSQGSALLDRMLAEVARETARVDLVSYRLTSGALTDALIAKRQAGVPVRVIIEPTQYRNGAFPEYWLVGAMVDRLWAAGVAVRQRAHVGLTHMKALVTSTTAMHGSSNFTRNWQRDHNYFIPAAAKPALHQAMADRVDAMWNDPTNFIAFRPQPPSAPALAAPRDGAATVPTAGALTWNRTPWAVAFDVYIGTDPSSLALAGRVNAVLNEDPPTTYSWQPGAPLEPGTRYFWQVVARTFGSDRDPSLVKASRVFAFTTGGVAPPPGPTPAPPPAPPTPPAPPSPGATPCTTIQPAPDWVCVNGGWLPPGSPLAGGAPAPPPPPAPVPPSQCATIQPAPTWVCVNGGWLPPGSPLAVGAPPPPVPPLPPATPADCGGIPDPFVSLGGGVCTTGGWVPRGHPLAAGR